MADSSSRTQKAFDDWRRAEARYADAVKAFGGDGPPAKVKKDSAVELATLRSKADSLRHAYFKRALK